MVTTQFTQWNFQTFLWPCQETFPCCFRRGKYTYIVLCNLVCSSSPLHWLLSIITYLWLTNVFHVTNLFARLYQVTKQRSCSGLKSRNNIPCTAWTTCHFLLHQENCPIFSKHSDLSRLSSSVGTLWHWCGKYNLSNSFKICIHGLSLKKIKHHKKTKTRVIIKIDSCGLEHITNIWQTRCAKWLFEITSHTTAKYSN